MSQYELARLGRVACALLLTVLCLGRSSSAEDADPITFASLLAEMQDRATLAKHSRASQFSESVRHRNHKKTRRLLLICRASSRVLRGLPNRVGRSAQQFKTIWKLQPYRKHTVGMQSSS